MSKVRDFATIISTGVASTDVSGLTTAITNEFTSIEHVSPSYIRTTLLYPAVSGNITNGTAHSGTYGDTVQTDGHKYYYTDIKGSKPIKDPRIGSHFGSQRHDFRSMQLLEQETATHGLNVWEMDGREWMRVVGSSWNFQNGSQGVELVTANSNPADFIEITGYFSQCNFLIFPQTNSATDVSIYIDGSDTGNDFSTRTTVPPSPLGGRFVNGNMLVNLNLGSTALGLHTLKIGLSSTYMYLTGCELIAQDTTSTATKSQIQIPSQNVVSYGKKFTVAETKHYNPFAFKTDGSTAWASGAHNGTAWPIGTGSSTNIDTATSLGLAAWVSTNYYYPYNGGRVVKWVASDGTIKTSVNMMPPNARSIANSATLTNGTAKANASIANNTFYPTFEATAVDHSQAEVAKTFHWREFGNGSANGNTSYKDNSTLTGSTWDGAYVMDDGLTSMSTNDGELNSSTDIGRTGTSTSFYITFIGTGITSKNTVNNAGTITIAQNLPYGTHILKVNANSSDNADTDLTIDGVLVDTRDYSAGESMSLCQINELTFHQPKLPPIPEDAVIIADYMLMADYVKQTDAENSQISKGVRLVSGSRDHFCDSTSHFASAASLSPHYGITGFSTGSAVGTASLTFFGNSTNMRVQASNVAHTTTLDGSATTEASLDNSSDSDGDVITLNNAIGSADYLTVGQHTAIHTIINGGYKFWGTQVISPIHTSSHYQTFETPYLHELVGGDRNMEQTNLVVTPDGKTWDEVTRNTSYMGASASILISRDGGNVSDGTGVINWDYFRGRSTEGNYHTKGFAPSYNEIICLVDGTYDISMMGFTSESQNALAWYFKINGTTTSQGSCSGTTTRANYWATHIVRQLKRGDALSLTFAVGHIYAGAPNALQFNITKVGNRK